MESSAGKNQEKKIEEARQQRLSEQAEKREMRAREKRQRQEKRRLQLLDQAAAKRRKAELVRACTPTQTHRLPH